MSSILKALKKLEEERSRQEQGRVDIATDILRTSGRQTSRNWSLALTVAALLLAGAGGGIYFSRAFFTANEPDSRQTTVTPAVAPPAAPLLPVASPAPKVEVPVPTPVASKTPAVELPVRVEPKPATVILPSVVETVVVAAESPPKLRPGLVVSGIVYQDDPQNRMAVINDLPVMSGTTIEGAEIVEILPDRVVFRFEGEQFSIGVSE